MKTNLKLLKTPGNYLYLGHPFRSRDKVREWELKVEKKLGIELHNPFFDTKEVREEVKNDGDAEKKGTRLYTGNATEIVKRDLDSLRNSVGMVAVLDGGERYGTIMEIVYGCYFFKPVFIIQSTGHTQHYWLQYHAQKVFSTLREFEHWLKKGLK
jgi:hypothetical protein